MHLCTITRGLQLAWNCVCAVLVCLSTFLAGASTMYSLRGGVENTHVEQPSLVVAIRHFDITLHFGSSPAEKARCAWVRA